MSPNALTAEVEAELRDAIRQRDLPRRLADALVYAALGPGKRVRPTLLVRSAEAVHGPIARLADLPGVLSGAAAIEMVHAFSLVHDDLPAMDDDDLRRGRATLHKHTDEATAVLAGDALQTLAIEHVTTTVADPALALRLIRELAGGTRDMIAGQVRDTFPDDDEADAHVPPIDRLVTTHRLKTGALLRAAARMGGHCAGANADQLDALTDYADAVGLMFQVVDDLLDVTSDPEQLGKQTQKDAAAGKRTYPVLMGLDGARAEVQRLRERAHAALAPLGDRAQALRSFADRLAVRQK
jgi:geranylgeranyl pyrophosphate synthase